VVAGQVIQVDCTADDDADSDRMTPNSEVIIQTNVTPVIHVSAHQHIYADQ